MRIFGRERETLLATVVCKTNGAQRNIIKYRVIYRRFSNENPFSGGRPNRWNERRCSVRFPCVLTIIFRTPVYNREEHSSRSCDTKRQFLWLLLRKHWEICNSIVRMCVIKFACFNWIPIFFQHRGSQHFFFFLSRRVPRRFYDQLQRTDYSSARVEFCCWSVYLILLRDINDQKKKKKKKS